MALPANGRILGSAGATQNIVIPGTPSGRSSLPTTFAILGSAVMASASIQLQAGFMNDQNVMEWINVGSAITTAGQAMNIAMRANAFRINVTGATGTSVVPWWFG